MCIAILQTESAPLMTFDEFENCWRRNPDGAGMLFSAGNELHTIKELDSVEAFFQTYEYIMGCGEVKGSVAIHFRYATHGASTEKNCHPFMINSDMGFIHNGIIHSVPDVAGMSDTRVFNEKVLKKLPRGFQNDREIMEAIEEYIGWSKLVFVSRMGEFAIANEKSGHWANHSWYSNNSYKGTMSSREKLTA